MYSYVCHFSGLLSYATDTVNRAHNDLVQVSVAQKVCVLDQNMNNDCQDLSNVCYQRERWRNAILKKKSLLAASFPLISLTECTSLVSEHVPVLRLDVVVSISVVLIVSVSFKE